MRARCYKETNKSYKNYGGRGITVCKEWRESFLSFYNDMGPRPFDGAQIDRIDNNKGYSKENCKWASHAENSQHTTKTILNWEKVRAIRAEYATGKHTQTSIAKAYGVTLQQINHVVRNKQWKEKICL